MCVHEVRLCTAQLKPVQAGKDYILYFGDTGADQVEGNDYLKQVWPFSTYFC
jgi:cAMP phosphodiesterase